MKKPKVCWKTPDRDIIGNGYGYSLHNRMMIKHTAPFIIDDPEADVVLQIVSADKFEPIEGKVNVLFTMWEFLDVPKNYQEALAKADYVIVPSAFCRDIFTPYCKNKPIVCWEGVDPDQYQFIQRKAGDRFRFLWVGAPNPRKGYQSVLNVIELAERFPKVEFYLKTTTKKITLIETIQAILKNWRQIIKTEKGQGIKAIFRVIARMPSPFNAERIFQYGKNKNVFVDTRKLPTKDLIDLYGSANAFLFPSLGEGWGLTLTEAMATGLPCISTDKTGCADYFDSSVGFPIKTEIKDLGALDNYKMDSCRAYIPDTQNFLDQMIACCNNYDEALRRGKQASDRIRTKFTWKRSGERLGQILSDIYIKEGKHEKADSCPSSDPVICSGVRSAV